MEQQILEIQQLLIQQAAMIAALQAQLAQQQQHLQPGPFAVTPALATQNVIDMTTSAGIKLHKSKDKPGSPSGNNPALSIAQALITITDDQGGDHDESEDQSS